MKRTALLYGVLLAFAAFPLAAQQAPDNDALRRFMIEQAGLGLNDGCSFGRSLNGYMRLNAACPRSVLERAMKQLEAAVKAL